MHASLIKYIVDHDGDNDMTIIKIVREFMESYASYKNPGPALSYKFEVEIEPGNIIICAVPDYAFWSKKYVNGETDYMSVELDKGLRASPYAQYWGKSNIVYAVTFGEHTIMVRNNKEGFPELQYYKNSQAHSCKSEYIMESHTYACECASKYIMEIMPICMLENYFHAIDHGDFKSNNNNDMHIFARDFPLSSPLIIPRKFVAAYCSDEYADIKSIELQLETLSDDVIEHVTAKFEMKKPSPPFQSKWSSGICHTEFTQRQKKLKGESLRQYLYLVDILGIKYD